MLQCRDIDALMMDWLYGELEPQKAQNFSTHLEDCSRCHTELSAYQRTRELVGGLPSQEPPSAVSAMLIREAASRATPKKAAGATSGGGFLAWFSKFFQPLQHPAMAAVATLVLVAGVAGSFWLKGESQLSEPKMERAPAVATTADRGLDADKSEVEPAPAEPAFADETAANESGRADDVATESTVAAQPAPTPGEQKTRRADLLEAKREEAERDLLAKSKNKREPKRRGKKQINNRNAPKKGVFKPNAVSGGDILGAKGDNSKDSKAPRKEAPGFEGNASASRPYRAYRDRPDSWVSQQQLRITEAYNRKDCVTAARIANDILDRSPELYTKNTKKLEGVKRCKAYVSKEARKRRLARKKRSQTGGKAAGKAKRSAKPAPADLESVESVK